MTQSTMSPAIHQVLAELGLPLPLEPETSWAFTQFGDHTHSLPDCRLTLGADGDLLVELAESSEAVARYVFDSVGHLVGVSQSGHADGSLLDGMRGPALNLIRRRCLLA